MRRCPSCGKWALDFDDYFGRFRCYDPECGWMPSSSAERRIRLLRSHSQPRLIATTKISELGTSLIASYDEENDALLFDLGEPEPTFDLPEGNGQIVWRIRRNAGDVVGFSILCAKRFGVSKVRIDLGTRKQDIEESLMRLPHVVASGRITKLVIESVAVTSEKEPAGDETPQGEITNAFNDALRKFQTEFV